MYGNNNGGYGTGGYGGPPPHNPWNANAGMPPPRLGGGGERREPAMVLILGIITCGIYYLIWMYNVSEETQRFLGEPDTSPGMEVLLTLVTCGLYNIYWDYKIGRKISRMQQMVGLPVSDNSWLYVILDVIQFGLINSMIQQGHLNEIWYRTGQANAYRA